MTLFRDYQPGDKAACMALFDSNVPRYFDPSERPLFVDFLAAPPGRYFVLEHDGAVVGCGGYAHDSPDADGTRPATFSWGMVDNARHKMGLGQELAERRLAAIRAQANVDVVRLSTTPQITAFFARFGFVAGQIEKDGFAPGMDKVRMALTLAPDPFDAWSGFA